MIRSPYAHEGSAILSVENGMVGPREGLKNHGDQISPLVLPVRPLYLTALLEEV